MSNDLVSQPWSQLPSIMGQMEQITNNLESPIPAMKMGFVPDNPASQQLSPSKLSMDFVGSMSKEFKLQKLSMLEVNSKQADAREKTMALLQNGLPPRQPRIVSVMNNHGTQQSSALTKRKAPMEPTSSLSPRSSSLPNKRPIQMMEHRPWLQGQLGSNRAISTQLVQQVPGSKNLPPQNKKSQIESSSPRPAPQKFALSKSQNVVSSSKVGGESSGSVRSKMRESLAAALALVTQQASKAPSLENKDEASVNREQNTGDQPDTSLAASQYGGHSVHEEHKETLPTVGELVGQTVSSVAGVDGSTAVHMRSAHQNFQSDMVISTDDVPFSDHFFVKDELLQGNGLTWMLESDIGMVEGLSRQRVVGNNLMQEGVSKEAVKSPEDLAAQIEAELYKLFGGVNKKYREKGRSLLFNLKDRSNPELRERVVSGEISPEKLCSMTTEELASKELSEWRMAKAEEFASMVVLPDSSADVRRLVKKTHKGEFEVVEIEQDEGISEEVSLGARSTLQSRPMENQNNSSKAKSSNVTKEVSGGKGNSSAADQDGQVAFTIPPEDQVSEVDIMVEDALGNLPPIVSLDEFMESLDTEPPFEELQVQDGKTTESPEKDGSEKNSPKKSPTAAGDAKLEKPHKTEEKKTLLEGKSNEGLGKSKSKKSPMVSEGQHVWQGSLQLNISSTALVVGIFKSGEKITTKDWSSSIEIKGRVRLDAFEKFLQDLRMSRSRALMVIHFLSNNGAPETERASITEVGESYVTDERVGFSEPCKGVDLYFCPPHTRTLEMLSKILPEDQIQQVLDSVDCGLIGVVIWRRNQFADNNNSSSSHKHNNPKKPHLSSFSSSSASKSRHDKAVNVMSSSRLSRPQRSVSNVNDIDDDDDDDDVPPGFGPTLTRDADDLPEFNFAGGRSAVKAPIGLPTQPVTRPVEQIRELILKYGQTGGSKVPLQPWNDDDDDIPEWQPHQVATPRADLGDNNPVYPLVARATKQHIVSPPPPLVWPAQGVVPYGGGVHGRQTYHQPRGRGY